MVPAGQREGQQQPLKERLKSTAPPGVGPVELGAGAGARGRQREAPLRTRQRGAGAEGPGRQSPSPHGRARRGPPSPRSRAPLPTPTQGCRLPPRSPAGLGWVGGTPLPGGPARGGQTWAHQRGAAGEGPGAAAGIIQSPYTRPPWSPLPIPTPHPPADQEGAPSPAGRRTPGSKCPATALSYRSVGLARTGNPEGPKVRGGEAHTFVGRGGGRGGHGRSW